MSKQLLRFAHAMPWAALGGGALPCIAVVVAMYGRPASPLGRWPGLGGLALCTGAAFILDDPARSTADATPMTLGRWRPLRLALALPLLLGVWLASLWAMTTIPATPFTPDARSALTLQFAAMLAVALAGAAVAIRLRRDHDGGLSGVVALFSLLGLGYALPHPLTLIAAPADDAWHPAQQHWGVLLALALLTVIWASRNPTVRRHPDARIPS